MEELHILLTPNKEHKKIFPHVPVVGFRDGKSLKDYLVRARLPQLVESGRCEQCGKKTLFGLWFYKYYHNVYCRSMPKFQKGPLNCDSEKVLYLSKFKVCGGVLYVGKEKTKFCCRLNNRNSQHRAFRKGNQKVPQKRFHAHYCLDGHIGIDD